jgi:bacteriorhodopsin
MSLLLSFGIFTFALSSLYFTIKPKEGFNSAFLVSFITLISYIIMYDGSFVFNGGNWTRWAFYGLSCGLLSYEISKNVGLDLGKRIYAIFLTVITMFTGALSSYMLNTSTKLTFFVISSIAFVLLLNGFFKTKSPSLKTITPYIFLGWCIFPIVFLLSNESLGLINSELSTSIYIVLDIFTKIIFYIHQNRITNKNVSKK